MCDRPHMATNVEIDPALIQDALRLGGRRTKREVIEEALREYVLRRKQQGILELFGTLEYDPDYDYKRQRRHR
jgi:Arc/MetJ family transcription regulator